MPNRRFLALLTNFGVVYLFGILLSHYPAVSDVVPSTLIGRCHFTLFFVPLSLTYVSLYSLIEHDSPSLLIVRALEKAGHIGCSRVEIEGLFQADLIQSRLHAAAGNGLVQAKGDQWMLTRAGRLLGLSSRLIMRIFGIREGG